MGPLSGPNMGANDLNQGRRIVISVYKNLECLPKDVSVCDTWGSYVVENLNRTSRIRQISKFILLVLKEMMTK